MLFFLVLDCTLHSFRISFPRCEVSWRHKSAVFFFAANTIFCHFQHFNGGSGSPLVGAVLRALKRNCLVVFFFLLFFFCFRCQCETLTRRSTVTGRPTSGKAEGQGKADGRPPATLTAPVSLPSSSGFTSSDRPIQPYERLVTSHRLPRTVFFYFAPFIFFRFENWLFSLHLSRWCRFSGGAVFVEEYVGDWKMGVELNKWKWKMTQVKRI